MNSARRAQNICCTDDMRGLLWRQRPARGFTSPQLYTKTAGETPALQTAFRVKLRGMKICSLLPSATEILFDLGLGDQVAGVSHECDFPPESRSKPVLIKSRITHTESA